MYFLYYFRYWFFIGINWSFPLAFFTLYHEIKGEKKYHLRTIEIDKLRRLTIKGDNLDHASIYQGCNYYILEKGFDYLERMCENKNMVDFGCGKGRALAVAAHYGFTEITGIDFARALCNEAEKNVIATQFSHPSVHFKIICDDVVNYKIDKDEQVFFFFNPFDEIVMLAVVKNILASCKFYERRIFIMYANPVHKEIFLSAGFQEVYYLKKLQHLELSILVRAPREL